MTLLIRRDRLVIRANNRRLSLAHGNGIHFKRQVRAPYSSISARNFDPISHKLL